MKKFLIVGLGNPGADYKNTRHNIGFLTLDALAKASNVVFEPGRYADTAVIKNKGRTFRLIKPNTFMNLSGKAVRYWMEQEKIPAENILVVVDDIALPFGSIRIKGKGSDAGHNGLKHIQQILGHASYPRLRFGIGNDFPKGGQVDYVLGQWTAEQEAALPKLIEHAQKACISFGMAGIGLTMTQFNIK